ncbi:CarD family transcriptional regulator [Streptomyces sp. SCSIO 30461]|uniref:CarD family transcriptional regulator n=1 Tax=Streptomyces sp. SCSIO 30461 TaxID=3118085 RepID=UPI0030CEBA6E
MKKPPAPKRHLPTSPFKAPLTPAPKHFAVGDQVTHDMHGLGRVIGIEDGIAALVDFGAARMRILSPYDKMTKL